MSNGLTNWLKGRQSGKKEIALEDVAPQHPNDYPARNLKRKLDERRAQSEAVDSHPTGMLDGPGALT